VMGSAIRALNTSLAASAFTCLMPRPASLSPALAQVRRLFPSASGLTLKWHSVVKISQSLYREAPGVDPFRPDQRTPVPNFFLAGSYTKQDYIDRWAAAEQ
jgi:uncharacterized protein with NAD-binding domain and iron-sulfur cluster